MLKYNVNVKNYKLSLNVSNSLCFYYSYIPITISYVDKYIFLTIDRS